MSMVAPKFVMAALPAVLLFKKSNSEETRIVILPAVLEFWNAIGLLLIKVTEESPFTMPAPLKKKPNLDELVKVYPKPVELNVKPPTVVLLPEEIDTFFWLDSPKVAVPVGTVAGVQLVFVLNSPVPLRFQVAFWACAATADSDRPASSAAMCKPLRDRHRASDPSVGIGNTP
ncbi:MAG TPA: hypothetical protein VFI58_19360 [Xanthobacteraceae bacterium]|nr:hypothetical protein [Xanthobacteraceae bacterium]